MTAFLRHAETRSFATARTAGAEDCDLSILVNREGGIHVIRRVPVGISNRRCAPITAPAKPIASIEPMEAVRLEARSATQSCMLAAERPERGLLPPLHNFPHYRMLQ